jgi:protein-S-isoprenylcysteine O-methyltransferase Ste14
MAVEQISYYANIVSFAVILALWFGFAGVFLLRKSPQSGPNKVGVPKSWLGLILQGLGFGIVWSIRRSPAFSPLIGEQYALNVVLQILGAGIAAVSVWLAMSAVRELGKQWSLQARLLEGHKLVTTGVYQIIRHPIYTAMMGMLISTGIVFSHWIALIAAIVVFLIGTGIRTSIEERLLSDGFGEEFREWKARVPGLIPFMKF